MYYVCRLTDDGIWVGLRSTADEDYAEVMYDYFCDLYPGAYLDILTYDEYHGGSDQWAKMATV